MNEKPEKRIVGFVFARGGSKGIVGKNLKQVEGQTLVARAVTQAKGSRYLDRVVISSDNLDIIASATAAGAEAPFIRPTELAGDTAPEWLAWRHALKETERLYGPIDVFVSVPPTAPLRVPADIDACVDRFLAGGTDAVITVTPAARNPYFNMVSKRDDGCVEVVIKPEHPIARRQDAPAVFDIATVCYVLSADYIRTADHLFAGTVAAVEVPQARALDIDTEIDLRVAQELMRSMNS